MMETLFDTELEGMIGNAIISDCGRYRYHLLREWDASLPFVIWVLLNPSTADASVPDPTIKKCVGFAKRWGFGSIVVRNLFCLRTPEPKVMKAAGEPIGPEGDDYLSIAADSLIADPGNIIVAGWGKDGSHRGRDREAMALLKGADVYCLVINKDGTPRHPLYVSYETELQRYSVAS